MCRLSKNVGAFAYWNRKGLSRVVMGLLYLALLQKNAGAVPQSHNHFVTDSYIFLLANYPTIRCCIILATKSVVT
jgi:hypothetical protein